MPLTDIYNTVNFTGAKGATNNTTPVTVVPDPASTTNPYIVDKEDMCVINEDTTAKTVILTLTGGTSRVIERVTLAVGDKWTNPNRIVVSNGETVTIQLSGAVTTSQLPFLVAYYQIVG